MESYHYLEKERKAVRKIRQILRAEIGQADPFIEDLVGQDRFSSYRSVPSRITGFLDAMNIPYSREGVNSRAGIFSIWLKLVDDEVERDPSKGKSIVDRLKDPEIRIREVKSTEPVAYFTELLKRQIEPNAYPTFLGNILELYASCLEESTAGSMAELITTRKAQGKYVARTTVDVLSLSLEGNTEPFAQFLQDIGEVGNLVDTCLDFEMDKRNGQVSFDPKSGDKTRLYFETARLGMKTLAKYPFMVNFFIKSLKRNARHLFQK